MKKLNRIDLFLEGNTCVHYSRVSLTSFKSVRLFFRSFVEEEEKNKKAKTTRRKVLMMMIPWPYVDPPRKKSHAFTHIRKDRGQKVFFSFSTEGVVSSIQQTAG